MLEGEGRYGISDSGIVLTRASGKPVKVLATIFQHSPLVLAVLKESGIRSFSDLHGKRIMLQPSHLDAAIVAALQQAGVGPDDYIRQPTSFDLEDLIDGNTDAFSVYLTDQPRRLQEQHIPFRLLNPRDYGIDFYGDLLFTSDAEVRKHPKRVAAFVEASIMGWEYALGHIDEMVALIQRSYNSQHLSTDQLRFEAYKTREIILQDVVQPGYMNPARWQRIIRYYGELGQLNGGLSVKDLLYRPEPGFLDFIKHYRWYLAIFTLALLLMISAIQSLLLQRIVRQRTRALSASESRFRSLVTNLPAVIYRSRADEALTIDFISNEIEAVSGYPAASFLGNSERGLLDIVHPEDRERVRGEIAQAIRYRHSYTIEYRILRSDGSVRWLHECGQPMPGEDDAIEWLDANMFDVTERRLNEELRHGISAALEAIISGHDMNSVLEQIIRIYEARHPGMRASVLLLKEGKLFHDAAPSLPAAYCETINGTLIGARAGSCGTAAFRGERVIVSDIEHDPLWQEYKALALSHGLRTCWSEPIQSSGKQVLGTFAMYYADPQAPDANEIRDIENAARLAGIAIERQRNSELLEKLQRAVEHSSEVVAIMDRNGIIEYINSAYSRTTGFPVGQAIGKPPALMSDPGQKRLVEEIRSHLERGTPWQGRAIEHRQDGESFPVMLSISPVRDHQGEVTHYISVQEDLTRLQEMEDRFRQAQKMEAIGTLVGGIAHDFNNLLAAIQGNSYLLGRQLKEMPPALDRIKNIDSLIGTASSMIRQLLTFARKDSVAMHEIRLNTLLKESFRLAGTSIPENIRRRISFCERELNILGDVTQLQQVLMNLLINARDAVEDSADPVISCSLEPFAVDEAFLSRHPEAETGEYAHLCIADNGCGIAEELLDKVFEPFFTTKETGKGSGLGLAMVYGAIRTHNGVIEIESEPGEGTSIHVYLPIHHSDDMLEQQHESNIRFGVQQTILLVDDDNDMRKITSEVLESLNYRVLQCAHGEEALALFSKRRAEIDLILTDVVMPVMGGIELAEHARRIDPDIAIIFATGYDPARTISKQGIPTHALHLNKPFTIEALSTAIARLLEPAGS